MTVLDGAARGEGTVAVHRQYFHDATSTRTRRNRVFALAEDRSGRDFANWNARKRDCIARVEVSFTVRTVAGCRRYQRECGACGENRCLSGARTKHHLGSDGFEPVPR